MSSESVSIREEIDSALATEAAKAEAIEHARLVTLEVEQKRSSRVGTALRHIGIAVLVASAATFLFQNWDGMEHVQRYAAFLGFTAMLCAGGLLTGLMIREDKGARTLLGAVALLVPVHCSQLGAILFSAVNSDLVRKSIPYYLQWRVASLSEAVGVLVIGLTVLLPLGFGAFAVLARQHRVRLYSAALLASGVLLVPTRDPLSIGLLLLFAVIVVAVSERRSRHCSELKTIEGRIVRSVPLLAVGILIGRQALLYQAPNFILGLIGGCVTWLLLDLAAQASQNKNLSATLETVGLPLGLASLGAAATDLKQVFDIPALYSIPLGGIVVTASLLIMARHVRYATSLYEVSAALAFVYSGIAEIGQIGEFGATASLISLVLGICGVGYACVNQERVMLFGSSTVFLVSLVATVSHAVNSMTISPWFALGVIGLSTVIGGSYIERNFTRLAGLITAGYGRVREWR